jgi:SSS family solute:Na+ symporter
MLLALVFAYLAVSVAIGIAAARRVHSARDYIVAGRNLPLVMVTAMVFATWFGAETVLGISGTFLEEGLGGLISDPFGAALCLVLFGLFFARRLYRLDLLTLGDFFRLRYGRRVELVLSSCIVVSYLGWVSAQLTALGLVFDVISDGAVPARAGMVIGAVAVLTYTLFGGMWSVAVTTFVQMIVIVAGLLFIAGSVAGLAGGVGTVVNHAWEAGRLDLRPEATFAGVLAWFAALLTLGFGSIPQQDVFQRANSAANERVAVRGSVYGGLAYLLFASVPLFLAWSALLIDEGLVERLLAEDAQLILPALVTTQLPMAAQIVFFGALLSVIMSTASGALLAPAVTFSENVLRGFLPRLDDRGLLWLTRACVLVFGIGTLVWSLQNESSIHQMVEDAYKVTLAAAFVPLAAGLYWSRANGTGAALSIAAGVVAWLTLEAIAPDAAVPPHLGGFLAGVVGMAVGGLLGPAPRARYETLLTRPR